MIRGQMAHRPAAEKGRIRAVAGILEAPVGVLPAERIVTFGGFGAPGGFNARLVGEPSVPEDDWGQIPSCGMNDLYRMNIWNRSAGLFDTLQIFVREAAAPAEQPGHALYLFCGLHQGLAAVEGHAPGFASVSWDLLAGRFTTEAAPEPEALANWAGSNHGQILKMPLWGWEAEPWAINADMHPGVIKEADALRRLMVRRDLLGETLDATETAELDRLDKGPARSLTGSVSSYYKDPMFGRYMAARVREDGIEALTMTGRSSLSEITTREEALSTLIRSLLDEDSPQPA